MAHHVDFRELAQAQTCAQFVAAHPHPFLLGANELVMIKRDPFDDNTASTIDGDVERLPSDRPRVFPIKKGHRAGADISVGRSSQNDVVIRDHQVSKIHCVFHELEHGFQLVDAGSRNGTWVGKHRLAPKGDARAVKFGDMVTLGHLAFFFLDPAGCWEKLRKWPHPPKK
jgi:hypothetical protein